MKTHRQRLLTLVIVIFVLSACTKTKKDSDPGPLTDSDNLVLVRTIKDNVTLTALDGKTGTVKWEIPFFSSHIVKSKTLYVNQIRWVNINHLSDTTLLYSNPDKYKNLLSIDASNGQVLTSVSNELKPNYMKGCCSTAQGNYLLGIEDGVAFVILRSIDLSEPSSASIYATDLGTGSLKWEYKLPSDKTRFIEYSGMSAISFDEGRIYVAGFTSSLALDAETGKFVQDYPIEGLVKPVKQTFYSISTNNNKVTAVDSRSGTILWEFKPDTKGSDWTVGQPLIYKDIVFICTYDGLVSALDLKSGVKKWEFRSNYPSPYFRHKISIRSEVLFVASLDGKLYALDPSAGDLKWEALMSDLEKNVVQTIEPKNGLHYLETKSGIVAVDSKTGQKVWKWNISQSSTVEGGLYIYDKTELNF